MIYDVTDSKSFENVQKWLLEVARYGCENVSKLLVGNKNDLEAKRVVGFSTAKELAETIGIPFLESSAKSSTNIDQIFVTLIASIVDNKRPWATVA